MGARVMWHQEECIESTHSYVTHECLLHFMGTRHLGMHGQPITSILKYGSIGGLINKQLNYNREFCCFSPTRIATFLKTIVTQVTTASSKPT